MRAAAWGWSIGSVTIKWGAGGFLQWNSLAKEDPGSRVCLQQGPTWGRMTWLGVRCEFLPAPISEEQRKGPGNMVRG